MKGFSVELISYKEAVPWLKLKHYAHRMPAMSYCFGLIHKKQICGIACYGRPPSQPECKSWVPLKILELQRLVVDTNKTNAASFLVSNSIRQVEKPCVFVSYADIDQGHIGYIYQATNWIYTGIGGVGNKTYILKNGESRQSRWASKIDKTTIDRIKTSIGKHRYYFFHGTKNDKKNMMKQLRFDVLPYPKGESKRYDATSDFPTQLRLF